MVRFEWDETKNIVNIKKHQVSFQEASSVFYDDNALLLEDPEHSVSEERYIILGRSANERILIVCHCYRENDEVIRIFSARKANKKERAKYIERLPL